MDDKTKRTRLLKNQQSFQIKKTDKKLYKFSINKMMHFFLEEVAFTTTMQKLTLSSVQDELT